MPTDTTTTLNMIIGWSQRNVDSLNSNNIVTDNGQIAQQVVYTTGVSGYINDIYHDLRTLASGGSINYNLTGLTQTILNNSTIKYFSRIKSITIKNSSTASGFNVNVNLSSASGFGTPFGDPSIPIQLGPNSMLHANNYLSGYIVDSGNKHIQINDMGSGARIELLIAGY